MLKDKIPEISSKIDELLKTSLPRDDYKELLELSKIFLGTMDVEETKFYKPGAFHHARWMAKAIYSLKMYIFRNSIKLSTEDEKSLQEISLFIDFVYVPYWYSAPLAAAAPNQDLEFITSVYNYRTIDKDLSNAVLQKFRNHLWYLSPEAAALSFFDQNISFSVRKKMVDALKVNNDEQFDIPKRFIFNMDDFKWFTNKNIDYFINSNSLQFFERFNIETGFLQLDSTEWFKDPEYLRGLEIVKNLRVVNDTAERAVKLAEEYVNILARSEEEKQYVIQVVSEYKKNIKM